ncbi:MAG: hypothetical protein WCI18_01455 [Pseudomonadota bacterium]
MIKTKKSIYFFTVAVQIFFLCLSLIKSYSPIPTNDMWDSYLGFMDKLSVGQFSAWWDQHNEHRIFLARLFFWADITWFHGSGIFLIFSNIFALASTTFMLLWWSRALLKTGYEKNLDHFLIYSWITIACTSWIQHENLSWGFQIQFILAQLIPLISFYLMSVYSENSKYWRFLYLSYLGGAMSLLTMGNGVLVLPLLLIQMFFLNLPPRLIVFFGLASLPPLLLYFIDYHAIAGHDSIVRVLRENPLGLLEYIVVYFGGPMNYLIHFGKMKILACAAFGSLFILLSLFKLSRLFWSKLSPLYIGLLVYLGYLIVSAIGTGGGRLKFGIDQALSSRYQTPVLFAWVALALIYLPEMAKVKRKCFLLFPMALLVFLFLSYNIRKSGHADSNHTAKELAMVALNVGVFDRDVLLNVYPFTESLFERFSKTSSPTFSKLGGYLPKGMYLDTLNRPNNLEHQCKLPLNDFKSERVDLNSFSISAEIDTSVAEYINASYFLALNDGQFVGAITQVQDDTSIFRRATNRYHGYIKVSDSDALNHLSWLCTAPNLN